MQLVGLLIGLVNRSLFYMGERGLRRANPVAKLAVAFLLIYVCLRYPWFAPLVIMGVAAAGAAGYGGWWGVSAVGLSSIPGLWFAATAYLGGAVGFSEPVTPMDALWIYLRATMWGVSLLFIASYISPLEIHYLLHRLGLIHGSQLPVLVWRLVPAALRGMSDSLAVGVLKGEKAGRRLAPAIAYMLEQGAGMRVALYHRLASPPTAPVRPRYGGRATLYLALLAFFLLVLILIGSAETVYAAKTSGHILQLAGSTPGSIEAW